MRNTLPLDLKKYAIWSIAFFIAAKMAIMFIDHGSTASVMGQPNAATKPEEPRLTAGQVNHHNDPIGANVTEAYAPIAHFRRPPDADETHPPAEISSTTVEKIETYGRLRAKALRTSDEDRLFKHLRRDPSVVNGALDEIQKKFDSPDTRSENSDAAQLNAITLVQDALLDPDYSDRSQLQTVVEQTILADNLDANLPRPILRRLASDKGELVLGYISSRPERIDFIKTASAETANHRVIENALSIVNRAGNAK